MKALNRFARHRFANLNHLLKNYDGGVTLHSIRVEVKKIKALLQLTNYCVQKFKAHKNFISFRALFREAGAIRQPEVFYNLLRTHHLEELTGTVVPESAQSERLSRTLQNNLPGYILQVKKSRKKLGPDIDRVKKACLRKYLRRKKKELKSRLFPQLQLSLLHKTRKIIKEIVYLELTGKPGKSRQAFYREAESLIGQWHDKKTLILMLTKNKKTAEVQRLKKECGTDIRKLRSLIADFYGRGIQSLP